MVATVTADAVTGTFSVPVSKLDAGIHVLTAQIGDTVVGNSLTVAVGTAADIVAKLPVLQASTGLSGIYLTDTHVLQVDSASAMRSLLASNGDALAAIQGGFSFAVTKVSGGTTTVASYTAGGSLVDTTASTMTGSVLASKTITKPDGSSAAYVYKDGVVTSETQIHADKTKDVYLTGITGTTYVSEHDAYDSTNTLISSVRTHADGTTDYKFNFNTATGEKVTETYTAAGDLAVRTMVTTTKDTIQLKYDGGVISSEYTYYAAGSDDIAALKTYTNGTLTRMNVRHADQSSDTFVYNISGKANIAQHDALDASGKVKFIDLTMQDGSHQITASQAHQTLVSTTHAADTFKGLGGDTFVFHKDFGVDQILGFHSGSGMGHDVIQIDKSMAVDKAHLSITSVGVDTLIHVTDVDSILLKSVAAASLTKDNFLFL
ncbi:hypothetical protein DA075_24420 [Methylobacterium currus]|uniref:Uncharacterized protein n=1 Tax=Methylobacterium currus TaxID=2051553 RepID=A0A2R4WQ25_9HYPH|nr:hypothetical protein DA075_24420 [Methylobacterium currus]